MRPDKDETFLTIAAVLSTRGTCPRRQVGCVLIDSYDRIIATGYNGAARSMPHCIDNACPGAHFPKGEGLSQCEAIHAEMNALLQCREVQDIHSCYVTTFPCRDCIKALLNTGCRFIYYIEDYVHPEARDLWTRAGRVEVRRTDLGTTIAALRSRVDLATGHLIPGTADR